MTQSTTHQASTKSAGIETFSMSSSNTSSTQTSCGKKLIEEYKAAYAAYQPAAARWKQAQEALRQGHHDGDLGGIGQDFLGRQVLEQIGHELFDLDSVLLEGAGIRHALGMVPRLDVK